MGVCVGDGNFLNPWNQFCFLVEHLFRKRGCSMMTKKSRSAANEHRSGDADGGSEGDKWVDRKMVDGGFKDERLGRRFKTLLSDVGGAIGASLPLACQDRVNTKAAYGFLANQRVGEAYLLSGHFAATRFAATDGIVLSCRTQQSSASSAKY
jgi:hypothetical protein